MRKKNLMKRLPGIKPGFDKVALRHHVEEADRNRAPTQDDLAASYDADADIVGYACAFPASIDELVEGIAAQDARLLDHGRKLLKQLLRKRIASAPPGTRKPRIGRAETPDVVPPSGADATTSTPIGSEATSNRSATPSSAPLFDADYSDADLYGV